MNFPESITNYLEQKISYKLFQDEIVNVTSAIAKEKFSVEDSKILLSQLSELIPKLTDSDFQGSTKEFFNFALNLADKQVYNVFFGNECSLNTQQLKRANEISMFIFQKLLNNGNEVLECINEKIEILKTIEKKFILLELELLILPSLENKNVQFQTLLPSLLKNLNLCVEKFVKTQGKYKNQEEMENQTKNMTQNFETWTISYLTRIIDVLINLKEIKNVNDDPSNPNYQIKFYIQLFLLDLLQGLIETINQGQYFDTTKIQQFFNSYILKLSSVFDSTCDILSTLLQQLKNLQYEGIKNPQMILVYTPQYRYNIVSCGYLLVEMFKDKNEHAHLSLNYKKELILNVIKEFFEYETSKDGIKIDLLNLFNQLFGQKIQNNQRNLNIYNVNLPKVLVYIIQFKSQLISQNQQEELHNSFRNVVGEFNENAQFQLFQEMIDGTDGLLCISFLMGEFIAILGSKVNDSNPQSCYFVNKNNVVRFIEKSQNKGEIHSISDRVNVIGKTLQIWELIFQQLKNNSNNQDRHLLNAQYKNFYIESVNTYVNDIQKQLTQFVTQSQKDKFDAQQKKEKEKKFNLEDELEKIKSKENLVAPLQQAIDHLKELTKEA